MVKKAKVEHQDIEHSTKNPGESIPDDIAQSIIQKCRRRCCMCWGIRGDKSEKDGQIAHLDRDRANNDEDNLVFLCKSCYDFFEKGRNSSRGYTSSFVRFNRDGLHEKLGVDAIVNKPEDKELYPEEQSVLVDFEEQLGQAIPNVNRISPVQSGFVAMDGHLVQLQVHNQYIASIPETIGNLKSLTKLALTYTKSPSLPETIGELTSLKVLDLEGNKFSSIPGTIGELQSLRSLNLTNN